MSGSSALKVLEKVWASEETMDGRQVPTNLPTYLPTHSFY